VRVRPRLRRLNLVNIGLLGCGRIGRVHAACIQLLASACLSGVFDPDSEAARSVAAQSGAKRFESPSALIQDSSVDAVIIATPTDTHIDLIIQAAEAQKTIFCEKPIDLSLARIKAKKAEILALRPRLRLGFNRRYDPSFAALHQAINRGEIGSIRQLTIISRDPDVPTVSYMKSAGGLLRDAGIHDFDMIRYLTGEDATSVVASLFSESEATISIDDHDTATVLAVTKSGIQCCVQIYRHAVYGYDQRVEVIGDKGMIMIGNERPNQIERWTATRTAAKEPLLNFFIERYEGAYRRQMDAFVEYAQNGTGEGPGFEEGVRALMIADAAYRAAASGRFETVDG